MPNHPKADPKDVKKLFRERLGETFDKFVKFSGEKNFVAFFLAKKNAGKGTYAHLLMDLTDGAIEHISVGDLYRDALRLAESDGGREELRKIFSSYYHGAETPDMLLNILQGHEFKKSLPTDLVLSLLEHAMAKKEGKSIIVDGFPRTLDQVEVAMQMKADFEAKGRPAVFVEINCPDSVLMERTAHRRACPNCGEPRNIKLLLTDKLEYEEETGEFHLICDNQKCDNVRMLKKQGDDKGAQEVAERNKLMVELMKEVRDKAQKHHLVVRNAVPTDEAHAQNHDMDDFTTAASLSYDHGTKQVKRDFAHWKVKDDEGRESYSRWPEAVVVEMIQKMGEWIDQLDGKNG